MWNHPPENTDVAVLLIEGRVKDALFCNFARRIERRDPIASRLSPLKVPVELFIYTAIASRLHTQFWLHRLECLLRSFAGHIKISRHFAVVFSA